MHPRFERARRAALATVAAAVLRVVRHAAPVALLLVLVSSASAPTGLAEAPARDAAAAKPRLPNILLISLDTTRADFLTFRDAETAPHMTRLAARGTVFTEAISGSSWTLPSHAQMFTGMAPPYHGTESSDVAIDPLMPTLPVLLDEAGYFTAGTFTVRYLWGDYGFARGFDVYRSGMLREDLVKAEAEAHAPRGGEEAERAWLVGSRDYVSSENVVALTRMALERAPPDEPVFLFAHFFDPHDDWVPPAPFDTRFDPDYDGPINGRGVLDNLAVFDPVTTPHRRVDDRGLEHLRALYRGEIAWTDQAVGQLLELLEVHRRLDDTLIIVTADHGEEFFEHDKLTHRFNLFDETIRVPLLIVLPRSLRQRDVATEIEAQVTLSDILPTVADLLGLEAPVGVTGRSLVPALRGEPFASRPELISLYLTKNQRGGRRQHMQIYGLRTPRWKFIRSVILKPDEPLRVQGELYDLVRDPQEKWALADPAHPALRQAWSALEAELDRARDAWRTQPRTSRRERSTDLSEESIAELRVLGYIDEGHDVGALEPRRPWGLAPMDPLELEPGPASRPGLVITLAVAIALGGSGAGAVWWLRRRGRSGSQA